MTYLWLVSFIWAFSFGLIKGRLTGVDSNFVAFARLAISLLVFLPFLRPRATSLKAALRLAGIGVVQFGIMYLTYIAAFRSLQAYEVALFTILTPFYVSVYDDLRSRRWRWLNLLTALLAILGTAVVQYTRAPNGFLLVQASNLAFAFGQVEYRHLMRRSRGVADQEVFGWLYLGGTFAAGLASLWLTPWKSLSLVTDQWLTLVYLGAVASGLGFFLWNSGARRVSAGALAIFNNLKIPLAVFVSLVFFGEKGNLLSLLAGGGIVLLALWLSERSDRLAKPAGAPA